MAEHPCPDCGTPMERRTVAPCYDCGADPTELDDLAAGRHVYDLVETLGARAVLCDFCQADFASYDPTYFGRPRGTPLGRDLQFVRRVGASVAESDLVCPACRRRLAFLRFTHQARAAAAA